MKIETANLNSAQVGDAGELLVCFDFVRRGYRAVANPFAGAPYDVLVDLGFGGVVRVQVKSTARPVAKMRKVDSRHGKARTQQIYRFATKGTYRYAAAGVDLFAFVAVDVGQVLYVPVAELQDSDRAAKSFGCQVFAERAAISLDEYLRARVFE